MATVGNKMKSDTVRLQVLLARCGLGSRRACEDYITAGRVTIDGEPATELGAKVDLTKQKVAVDGESIRPDRSVCYMVNKPKGVLCTNSDPSGRPRVVDLFPTSAGRLFPVGRLDENSVGLLLVTNDGDLGHRLAHPRFKVPKIYEVQVAGRPSREIMQQLRQGMYFSDGRFKVDNAKVTGTRGKSTILEVTLSEGRNREIRRLFSRVGHKVMKLERVAFGPLRLRGVTVGKFRALSGEEMKLLYEYIENGERRARLAEATTQPKEESPKRAQAPRKPRKGPERRVVEIGPITTTGGRDMTGRKRVAKSASEQQIRRHARDDDDDDEPSNLSAHPAMISSKRPVSPANKPQLRKAAVRRPVTVNFDSKSGSGDGAAGAERSKNSKRSAETKADAGKAAGKKSMSRKKEVRAKQASRKRKKRR